ncbi:carotenoid oxygenase family protein [Gordonia sp. ABSL1-1]|uniref:carotenoid oxygenase family protein n=1 Tax=Gordonia sp. ABSL1-1 TaxID=3053923 RepID=UPI0025741343|nr:carotenoid oxygenase family protein [Gordonia sp. ABSL1-1]MDL9938573.1 carotenoid oxygenase family protein [Gordonia sp. ABSL1-1]
MATAHIPAPVDLANAQFLSGVFAPQRTETTVDTLPVTGELPAGLRGSYLRNGPNPRFDPIGSFVYPIDGDGMVHEIGFDDGRVSYRNRFVRTPMVIAEEAAGHAIWSGITDGYTPSAAEAGPLAGTTRELPDINIVRHGGRLMAMAEADQPYLLDPAGLATLARTDCDGAMRVGSTAHPKIDPATGEMVLFNYTLEAPFLTWSTVDADGHATRTPTAVDGLTEPVMIHDMALTTSYIVLFVCPLIFDLEAAMTGGSLLSWRPDDGTRIALIPRDGSPVRWLHTDPFWVWHFANAFDNPDGTGVTVDYVEWTYPGGFADQPTPAASTLTRAVLHPDGTVSRSAVSDNAIDMEFPRVDDRLLTRDHRRIATVAKGPHDRDALDSLWFHDLAAGTEEFWSPGVAIGEPIFIPGVERDHWGAIGTDPTDMRSRFYLLAADDPSSGPVATVDLPIRVPAGLHGAWLPKPVAS